jgi:hypothetical protein
VVFCIRFWCDFTRKLEPILARSAEAQPQRLRMLARARPTRKTLSLFIFEISPRRISFLVAKGVFWWWRLALVVVKITNLR